MLVIYIPPVFNSLKNVLASSRRGEVEMNLTRSDEVSG